MAWVEMDGRSCRELLEGRVHSRSLVPRLTLGMTKLGIKVEGGGAPWHGWRWIDRVE